MNPRIKLPVMLTRKICHGQELLFGSISSNPHRETAPAIPPKATKRIVLISTGKNVTTSQKVFGDVSQYIFLGESNSTSLLRKVCAKMESSKHRINNAFG